MKNKLHNRTLFVAALSVYFGLLIVGAPPQVLAQNAPIVAHAATPQTKRVEAEDSDESLKKFLDNLKRLVADGSFDLTEPFEVEIESDFSGGQLVNSSVSLRKGDDSVYRLAHDLVAALDRSDYLFRVRDGAENRYVINKLKLKFELNDATAIADFRFETDSPESARKMAAAFSTLFSFSRYSVSGKPEAVVYKNARITFENNQVFIVTRLPRGSLAAILKG